jgi:hypothetical protein
MLFSRVVVRLFVLAKYNSLANKIERVRTAAEATIGSVEVVKECNRGDSSVVVGGVIKDEVT